MFAMVCIALYISLRGLLRAIFSSKDNSLVEFLSILAFSIVIYIIVFNLPSKLISKINDRSIPITHQISNSRDSELDPIENNSYVNDSLFLRILIKKWDADTRQTIKLEEYAEYAEAFQIDPSVYNSPSLKMYDRTILFDIPDTMVLEQDTFASITIMHRILNEDWVTLPGAKKYRVIVDRLSSKIKAELYENSKTSFDIGIRSSTERVIDTSIKIEWHWCIKPLKYGNTSLETVLTSMSGNESYGESRKRHEVFVVANTFEKIWLMLRDNIQWIGLIVAILALPFFPSALKNLFSKIRKKKNLDNGSYWWTNRS